jgi:chromosome segregation ATPase
MEISEKRIKQTQHTLEGHSSRLEQAEGRISELEDKIEVKGNNEELLVKQLKTCKRNIQELTDSIKRTNLRIMDIEEGEEIQAKRTHNIVNKIITENFSNRKTNIHSGTGSLQNTKQT